MALCLIGCGSILMVVGGIICLQSLYSNGYKDGYVAGVMDSSKSGL